MRLDNEKFVEAYAFLSPEGVLSVGLRRTENGKNSKNERKISGKVKSQTISYIRGCSWCTLACMCRGFGKNVSAVSNATFDMTAVGILRGWGDIQNLLKSSKCKPKTS